MLSEYEKRILSETLNKAHLTKLPAKADIKDITWIEGIGKIKLMDGSYGFGIVKRNKDLTYNITYINGATSPIVHIEEVYPYVKIDKSNIHKFANKEDRESRIAYLQSLHLPYNIDFESMNIAELNKEIVKATVYHQLNTSEK